MKTRMSTLVAVLVSAVVLFLPTGVSASGYDPSIGGYAGPSIEWYYTPRDVTYPPTAGPEVAFRKAYGPAGLNLGAHNCNRGDAGPIYQQVNGSWDPVAYYQDPTTFCLFSFSDTGSGSFGGELAWD